MNLFTMALAAYIIGGMAINAIVWGYFRVVYKVNLLNYWRI